MIQKPKHKRRVPKRSSRGQIDEKNYQQAINCFGNACFICGNLSIEMHHIVFRSQGGRGGFRNLIPLCNYHHRLAHSKKAFNEFIKQQRIDRYGRYFWADKYDLYRLGLINDPTDKKFEEFMKGEELDGH